MLDTYVQASNDTSILRRALPLAEVCPLQSPTFAVSPVLIRHTERVDMVGHEQVC